MPAPPVKRRVGRTMYSVQQDVESTHVPDAAGSGKLPHARCSKGTPEGGHDLYWYSPMQCFHHWHSPQGMQSPAAKKLDTPGVIKDSCSVKAEFKLHLNLGMNWLEY